MNQLGFNLNQNNLVPWYTAAGTQYSLSGATLQPGCSYLSSGSVNHRHNVLGNVP